MPRTVTLLARPLALAAALAACGARTNAREAGQTRYHGRTLEEWWQLRRSPDDETAAEASDAMRALGAAAVPFLAEKAASHDLGDVIGSSVALEAMCPNVIPAMEAARASQPSAALDGAIRRVRADTAVRAHSAACRDNGDSAGTAARAK